MIECTQENLDLLLDKRWIRLGSFKFFNCTTAFAMNIVKDDVYLVMGLDDTRFGYDMDEDGKIQSFIFENKRYTLSENLKKQLTTPIKERLATTTAIFDIVAQNADVRWIRQTEAALAFLAFNSLDDMIGEDLTDPDEGTHFLLECSIVEPDSSLESDQPSLESNELESVSDSNHAREKNPASEKSGKTRILQFRSVNDHW